jgi:hypothetical protein
MIVAGATDAATGGATGATGAGATGSVSGAHNASGWLGAAIAGSVVTTV